MDTPFYILISLRTPTGYDAVGEFDIGYERDVAYALFDSLEGDNQYNEQTLLHLDLVETRDALPEKIRIKCCNLEQLARNTKIIVREAFRQKNLERLAE